MCVFRSNFINFNIRHSHSPVTCHLLPCVNPMELWNKDIKFMCTEVILFTFIFANVGHSLWQHGGSKEMFSHFLIIHVFCLHCAKKKKKKNVMNWITITVISNDMTKFHSIDFSLAFLCWFKLSTCFSISVPVSVY